MPAVPVSMRKLKEILRLKYGPGLSHRLTARSLVISPSVVTATPTNRYLCQDRRTCSAGRTFTPRYRLLTCRDIPSLPRPLFL
ncbi:hypothetical protein EKG95_27285 [Salmonella enterica subsp. enterica serovar Aqua]|uniref:Transposase n=1 Tax=Salmonella enterica subsp. enterica serovar Aqua TaxID=1302615 RepID=A0A5X6EUD0_SALET|nr:hypothetical protein [Salmonella enterica subsp. enterica serovar Aqua]